MRTIRRETIVGAVYDRAHFVDSRKKRAVIDRAYRCFMRFATPYEKKRNMVWLSIFSFFAIVLLLLIRHTLLVGFLALKIIGDPGALDAWKGPVVNPTGKNSLDLVRISEGLAQSGFEVFVPDFAEMRKLHLTPEESGKIKKAFQFIGRDAGVACFSYGCGPAVAAAADPGIRDHVRFVLAFGGYFDIREALEFLVTGPEPPVAWAKSDY